MHLRTQLLCGLAILTLFLVGCAGTEYTEITAPGFHIISRGKSTDATSAATIAAQTAAQPHERPTIDTLPPLELSPKPPETKPPKPQ